MNSASEIEHNGVVYKIEKNSITVKINAHPSCSSCHASQLCNASGTVEKFFEVPFQGEFKTGQDVRVITSLSNGFRALALGYVIPLTVLVTALIIMIAAGSGELVAGIASVGLVGIYYLILFLSRDKIEKKIKFTLKPA
ncbi:MAG: SoxR reducing system RseC family protein [Bacteroidales bacterium]